MDADAAELATRAAVLVHRLGEWEWTAKADRAPNTSTRPFSDWIIEAHTGIADDVEHLAEWCRHLAMTVGGKIVAAGGPIIVKYDEKDLDYVAVKSIIAAYSKKRPATGIAIRLDENKVRVFCERYKVKMMTRGRRRRIHGRKWLSAFRRYWPAFAKVDPNDAAFLSAFKRQAQEILKGKAV